jgi:hypothetical protein
MQVRGRNLFNDSTSLGDIKIMRASNFKVYQKRIERGELIVENPQPRHPATPHDGAMSRQGLSEAKLLSLKRLSCIATILGPHQRTLTLFWIVSTTESCNTRSVRAQLTAVSFCTPSEILWVSRPAGVGDACVSERLPKWSLDLRDGRPHGGKKLAGCCQYVGF